MFGLLFGCLWSNFEKSLTHPNGILGGRLPCQRCPLNIWILEFIYVYSGWICKMEKSDPQMHILLTAGRSSSRTVVGLLRHWLAYSKDQAALNLVDKHLASLLST